MKPETFFYVCFLVVLLLAFILSKIVPEFMITGIVAIIFLILGIIVTVKEDLEMMD